MSTYKISTEFGRQFNNIKIMESLHVSGVIKFDVGSDATGDLYYRNSSGELSRLAIGANGKVLGVTAGALSWVTATSSETDPVFTASAAYGIEASDITNWDNAHSWGNHATAGYLTTAAAATAYQPLDGDLTAIAGLAGTTGFLKKTAANTWTLDTNTYLTSFTETDPVFSASIAAGITSGDTAQWDTAYSWGNHASANYELLANKGAANGYVPLNASTKIDATYLPSYVDDVLEYATSSGFPATGETGKIYIAIDSGKVYRWSGSAYVEIVSSPGSTDAVSEGSTNLYFTQARVLSTVLTGYSVGTNTAIAASDTVLQAFQKLQGQINNITGGGSYQPLDADLTAIAALTGTGLLRRTGADTWSLDTNTYLTANQSITLSGEVSGSGTTAISTTVANSAVIGKVLTGYSVGTNTALAATDTILEAFEKIQGQLNNKQASGSYQPLDGDLTAIAALSGTGLLKRTGADTWSLDTNTYLTSADLSGYVPTTRTLTINGTAYDLSANRSWTIPDYTLPIASGAVLGGIKVGSGLAIDGSGVLSVSGTGGLTAAYTAFTDGTNSTTTTASTTFKFRSADNKLSIVVTDNDATHGDNALFTVNEGNLTIAQSQVTNLTTDLGNKQPLDADLTAIAALAGTNGLLKKTAADTWTLDTNTYLTSFTEIDPIFTAHAAFNVTSGKISNWDTAYSWGNHASAGYELVSNKGAANGYVPLNSSTKIDATYLPAYVDDVLEYSNFAGLPGSGTAGIIYVTLDNNKIFRWSGSAYVEISASPGSTDAVSEGSTNLYFTQDRVLSTVLTGYSVGANTALAATDTVLQAFQKLQGQINNLQPSGSYQPLDADLTAIAALTGTGFLKRTGADTWSLDTNTYLTANQSITLSGEVSGSGTTTISTTVANSAVIGKVLTGYSVGTNTALAATDTILQAFQKIQGQLDNKQASGSYVVANGAITGATKTKITYDSKGLVTAGADATTTDISEGTNQYFTTARVLATALTGYSVGTNTALAATDTILQAFQKVQGQINAKGAGTVTSVSVTTANGVSGTVATETTTPAITITLGDITPTSVFITKTTEQLRLSYDANNRVSYTTASNGSLTVTNTVGSTLAANSSFTGVTFGGQAVTEAATGTHALIAAVGINAPSITAGAGTTTIGTTLYIAGAPSNATTNYALYVAGGNSTFIGNITANSFIKSGGTSSQFLKADGSVDSSTYLTTASASSSYQPLDADLTAIAALAGTSGLLRKTAADTWSLDTNAYLTGNQSITLSGEASGSGATAISVTLANSAVIGKVLTGYSAGSNTAIAATDTIVEAFQKVQGQINNLAGVTNNKTQALSTGSNVVLQFAKTTTKGIFIDYVVYNGTNQRSGVIAITNDGTNTPKMNETSTEDIGATTAITTAVAINGSNVEFSITGVPDNSYTVKLIYRYI